MRSHLDKEYLLNNQAFKCFQVRIDQPTQLDHGIEIDDRASIRTGNRLPSEMPPSSRRVDIRNDRRDDRPHEWLPGKLIMLITSMKGIF